MPAYILQQSKAIVLHSALLFKKWPEQTTDATNIDDGELCNNN